MAGDIFRRVWRQGGESRRHFDSFATLVQSFWLAKGFVVNGKRPLACCFSHDVFDFGMFVPDGFDEFIVQSFGESLTPIAPMYFDVFHFNNVGLGKAIVDKAHAFRTAGVVGIPIVEFNQPWFMKESKLLMLLFCFKPYFELHIVYRLQGESMNNNNCLGILIGLLLGAIIGFFAGYKYAEHCSRENNTIRFELRCEN